MAEPQKYANFGFKYKESSQSYELRVTPSTKKDEIVKSLSEMRDSVNTCIYGVLGISTTTIDKAISKYLQKAKDGKVFSLLEEALKDKTVIDAIDKACSGNAELKKISKCYISGRFLELIG